MFAVIFQCHFYYDWWACITNGLNRILHDSVSIVSQNNIWLINRPFASIVYVRPRFRLHHNFLFQIINWESHFWYHLLLDTHKLDSTHDMSMFCSLLFESNQNFKGNIPKYANFCFSFNYLQFLLLSLHYAFSRGTDCRIGK